MIINDLYARLNHLVPEPNCSTRGDEYSRIIWRDARRKPTSAELIAVDADVLLIKNKKTRVQQRLKERSEQELPYGQLVSMMIILLKEGTPTGAERAEQATQRVTLGKIKALQAHAKQLDGDLDRDVNTDVEVGW